MPVQIPTLKRIEPQAEQSVGRLQTRVADDNRVGVLMKGLGQIADKAIDYSWHVEDQAMDTAAMKADTEYQSIYNSKLEQAKAWQGDPTEAYKLVDDEMKKERDRLLNDETISDRTRTIVQDRLDKRNSQMRLEQSTQFNNQLNKYTLDTYNAAAEFRLKDYTNAATYIDPANPDTFERLDNLVNDSVIANNNLAIKLGLADPDPEGSETATTSDGTPYQISLKPRGKLNQQKEISKGLFEAMDNVLKAGGPNAISQVSAMKKKYWDLLDTDSQQKIDKQMKSTGVDQMASEIAATTKTMDEIEKATANLPPAERMEVQKKAISLQNDFAKVKEYRTNKYKEQVASNVANEIYTMMRSPLPPQTESELMSNPKIKNQWDRLDADEKEKMLLMVQSPKVSNEHTKNKMDEYLTGMDPSVNLATMDDVTFARLSAGLSEKDKAFYNKQRTTFKTETEPQAASRFARGNKELENQLQLSGYIKKNDYGHYEQKDFKKLLAARNEFVSTLAAMEGQGPEATNKAAIAFATAKMNGSVYTPPERKVFNGGAPKDTSVSKSPITNVAKVVKGRTRGQWASLYAKTNKGQFPNDQQLNEYIKVQP